MFGLLCCDPISNSLLTHFENEFPRLLISQMADTAGMSIQLVVCFDHLRDGEKEKAE
jgi:hypothetical protein